MFRDHARMRPTWEPSGDPVEGWDTSTVHPRARQASAGGRPGSQGEDRRRAHAEAPCATMEPGMHVRVNAMFKSLLLRAGSGPLTGRRAAVGCMASWCRRARICHAPDATRIRIASEGRKHVMMPSHKICARTDAVALGRTRGWRHVRRGRFAFGIGWRDEWNHDAMMP